MERNTFLQDVVVMVKLLAKTVVFGGGALMGVSLIIVACTTPQTAKQPVPQIASWTMQVDDAATRQEKARREYAQQQKRKCQNRRLMVADAAKAALSMKYGALYTLSFPDRLIVRDNNGKCYLYTVGGVVIMASRYGAPVRKNYVAVMKHNGARWSPVTATIVK